MYRCRVRQRKTLFFFFSSRRRHTRCYRDWSSDVCSSDLDRLPGAIHPVVRTNPRTHRRALYLASHASRIVDWPLPEGRLLLHDLIEHATQREFIYRHTWRVGDLVIWDNRCTMHRARPFADTQYPRELRRVTTLDIGNA